MKNVERRSIILEMVKRDRKVRVTELAKHFGVSEMTIRRDLDYLSRSYNIRRTHGGAELLQSNIVRIVSFDESKIEHKREKSLIARKAAELIGFKQRIFIDSGSTAREMVNYLAADKRTIVVTNSLRVADVALKQKELSVIMIGGEILPIANCSSGTVAEEQILKYELDIAFLGAAAVGRDGKLYDGYSPEARLKDKIFEVTKSICLLVDSSKFDIYDLHEFGSLAQVDAIITDSGIKSVAYDRVQKYNTKIIIADEE